MVDDSPFKAPVDWRPQVSDDREEPRTIGRIAPPGRRTGPRTIPPPPAPDAIARPELLRDVATALDRSASELTPVVTLAGHGGSGKSTLAKMSVALESVVSQYPGGVIWIEVGQGRIGASLAATISDICQHLGGERPQTADPLLAGAVLAECMADRPPSIMVIDDVWHAEQSLPFVLGAPNVARLFTARNPTVVGASTSVIEVGAMRLLEATATLLTGLPQQAEQEVAERLLYIADGWALLLGLMNAFLREQTRRGADLTEIAAWLEEQILASGPTALDAAIGYATPKTLSSTIDASLALLSTAERDRCLDLAVIDEDAYLPTSVLEDYWRERGGLSPFDSQELLARLNALRLVDLSWRSGQPHLSLHDLVRAYFEHCVGESISPRHRDMVSALSFEPSMSLTAAQIRVLRKEPYTIQALPHHLLGAGMSDACLVLATDLEWIAAQILEFGSVSESVSTLAELGSSRARTLARALSEGAYALRPGNAASTVRSSLAHRLIEVPAFAEAARNYLKRLPSPVIEGIWSDVVRSADSQSTGHVGPVGDCVASPNGQLLASVSDDLRVILWNAASMTTLRALRGHSQRVRACAFSPSGDLLASAGLDGTVRIWECPTGKLRQLLGNRSSWALGVCWAEDGTLLASAHGDGYVRVWSTESWTLLTELHASAEKQWDCEFVGASELISVGDDGVLRWWSITNPERPIHELPIHEGRIRRCSIRRQDGLISTAGADGTVCLVSRDGTIKRRLPGHTNRVRAARFSETGDYLVSASEDRTVRVWRVEDGAELRTLSGHTDWVGSATFLDRDRSIVSCGGDGSIRRWTWETGDSRVVSGAIEGVATSCAVSTVGLVAGTAGGALELMDPATGRTQDARSVHDGRILSLSVAGTTALTTGADGRVVLSSLERRGDSQELWKATTRVWSSAISASSGAAAVGSDDGNIYLLSLDHSGRPTGRTVGHPFRAHEGGCFALSFDRSGRTLFTCGEDGIVRASSIDGRVMWENEVSHRSALWTCSISPRGDHIAVSGDVGAISVLRTADGQEVDLLRHEQISLERVRSLRYSHDGAMLASVGDEGLLSIWSVDSGQMHTELRLGDPLTDLTWLDQNRLFSVGQGGRFALEIR